MEKNIVLINKKLKKLKNDFEEISNSNIGDFGFKERIKLERTLYLLLLDLTEIELSGFNDLSLEKIVKIKDEKTRQVAQKIYKLRIFLKKISSSNPYERYDAINELSINRKTVFLLMRKKIDSLIKEIENHY